MSRQRFKSIYRTRTETERPRGWPCAVSMTTPICKSSTAQSLRGKLQQFARRCVFWPTPTPTSLRFGIRVGFTAISVTLAEVVASMYGVVTALRQRLFSVAKLGSFYRRIHIPARIYCRSGHFYVFRFSQICDLGFFTMSRIRELLIS